MIDVDKCTFENLAHFNHGQFQETVYFFTYPKDDAFKECTNFNSEESYGNVVGSCISLTLCSDGDYNMQISPTVESEDGLIDVDWHDLREHLNFNVEIIQELMMLTKQQ